MYFQARVVLGTAVLIPAAVAAYADPLMYGFVTSTTPYGVVSTRPSASPPPTLSPSKSLELGAVPVNVGYDATNMAAYMDAPGGGESGFYQGDLYRVPEPSSLALFGIGLLIGGGLIHRKLGGRRALNMRNDSAALASGTRAKSGTYDA